MEETTYELQSRYQYLKELCVKKDLPLPVEPGCHAAYEGMLYRVLAVRPKTLAVVNEFCSLPFQENSVTYIENWQENPLCTIYPSIEGLLSLIWDLTSLHPTLVPGIQTGKEVWKAQHPQQDHPYIFKSAHEALLELTVGLLEEQKNAHL